MAKILSIIAARKGSKGLPSKCMLQISQKPIVEHVIKWSQSLLKSDIDVITVVSTDIVELKDICKKYSAVYIHRPNEYACDTAHIEDVMYHACKKIESQFDYISLLYGNIPLRHSELFYGPLSYLEANKDVDAVLTFQDVEKFHPAWMVKKHNDFLPNWQETGFRRQDLEKLMIHDGHTILCRYDYFINFWGNRDILKTGQMFESFGKKIKPWLHDKLNIDIDTKRDYLLAKAILESNFEL